MAIAYFLMVVLPPRRTKWIFTQLEAGFQDEDVCVRCNECFWIVPGTVEI